MIKTLVLVRHAHRDPDADEPDNGLSRRGLTQARALADFARRRGLGASGVRLLASPKLRARQTLAPLGDDFGLPVSVDPRLDERDRGEAGAAFTRRVQTFLDEWRASRARMTIACSHGDWLPIAYERLVGVTPDLPNCAWLEVDAAGGEPRLAWFVPNFDW